MKLFFYVLCLVSQVSVVSGEIISGIQNSVVSVVSDEIIFHVVLNISVVSVVSDSL